MWDSILPRSRGLHPRLHHRVRTRRGRLEPWSPALCLVRSPPLNPVCLCLLMDSYVVFSQMWNCLPPSTCLSLSLGGYPPFHESFGRQSIADQITRGEFTMVPSKWSHISDQGNTAVLLLLRHYCSNGVVQQHNSTAVTLGIRKYC